MVQLTSPDARDELLFRHGILASKLFLSGLTPEEQRELAEVREQLDKLDQERDQERKVQL